MSTDSFQLDTQRTMPALNYVKWMRRALESGKSLGSMIKEIASLQFGKGKLQPEEYFLYQLYDDERYTPEAKRTFMGIRGPTVESPWAQVVHDKPTLTAILQGLGLPVPHTQAIVHTDRMFAGAQALRTPDDLRHFLREDAAYPIFGKPFDSACSLGTANITEFDYANDALILSDGESVDLDTFVDQVKKLDWKYLLQTLMLPHPDVAKIIGDRVSTVRMFVVADDEGCELMRASWKIPASINGADNFWRTGNILAGIDVETGRIVKTLQRTKDGTQPIDKHPLTETSFEDLVFPRWDEMRDLVLRAAPNLPGCFCQGWDVALTDVGPVLVELEGDGGDPIMEQLCFDTGLLQGRYERLLEKGKELEKKKKQEAKERRNSDLRRNFSTFATAKNSSSNATGDATEATETPSSVSSDSPVSKAEEASEEAVHA